MNTESFALRIYARASGDRLFAGFRGSDFNPHSMMAGVVIVEPVRLPALVGGLHVSADLPGIACLAYRVLAVAALQDIGDTLALEPGDVVVLRTSQLDPLQPDQNVLAILGKHIIAKILHD